jgi:hypothetical protein
MWTEVLMIILKLNNLLYWQLSFTSKSPTHFLLHPLESHTHFANKSLHVNTCENKHTNSYWTGERDQDTKQFKSR